jgi:hypothetical protein
MPADRADYQTFHVNFFHGSHGELLSCANPRLTAPSTFQASADVANPRMAPGVGGFNIDSPVPRVVHRDPTRLPPSWTSIEKTLEHLTGKPVSNASPAKSPLSLHVNSGLTAPSTSQATTDVSTPPMAPGVRGFNIDPPLPRAKSKLADADSSRERPTDTSIAKAFDDDPIGFGSPMRCRLAQARTDGFGTSAVLSDVAVQDMRRQYLSWLEPRLVPQPPIRARRKAIILSTGDSSVVFNLLGITAVTIMLLAFADEARKPEGGISKVMPPLHEVPHSERSSHVARLVVEDQKGFTNEPLPLGISIKNASDGETVTVAGLADGTELSLGNSKGRAGWLLSTRDLDKTFVGARDGFAGVMEANVSLHSASGQLLDSQVIRFEWTDRRYNVSTPAPVTTSHRPPELKSN